MEQAGRSLFSSVSVPDPYGKVPVTTEVPATHVTGLHAPPLAFRASSYNPATVLDIKARFNQGKAVAFVALWGINGCPVTWGQWCPADWSIFWIHYMTTNLDS